MTRRRWGERSKLYWGPPIVFACILLLSMMLLTFRLESNFHTAGFITAAIMASIGFHLFSLGNTAYGCAAALENKELTEYAYHITQNGIYANFGAGGVFLISVLWFLLSGIEQSSEFYWYSLLNNISGFPIETIEAGHFWLLRLGLAAGVTVFAYGFLRQSRYSHWYTVILKEIGASEEHSTIVDGVLERVDPIRRHDTIIVVDQSDFVITSKDFPRTLNSREEYTLSLEVENQGDQKGTRTLVYEFAGQVVDEVEKTLEGGERTTIERDYIAPEEEGEYEIDVYLES